MLPIGTSPIWPKTNSDNRPQGTLRTYLNDFRVFERRSEELSGEGEHLYIQIQKTNVTTTIVQSALARHFEVPVMDVSFAGLKDKRSIATQWFSVRLPKKTDSLNNEIGIEGCSVLYNGWHHKKLRRGNLDGNDFEIVVRNVEGPLPKRLKHFADQGFPNYFGPQRFGNNGNNISQAADWIESGKPRVSRFRRSVFISTLRSVLFNDVLGERIRDHSWKTAIAGDLLTDGSPTGPLWGRGRPKTEAHALDIELRVMSRRSNFCDALEWVGLSQQRRSLVEKCLNFHFIPKNGDICFKFSLRKGSYANVALSELFDLTEKKE